METSPPGPRPRRPTKGFTLIEIMVVVVIIGLLAALAFPMYQQLRRTARQSAFINDLRIARDAIFEYTFRTGGFPPDGSAAIPTELDEVLRPDRWSKPTPIGGQWDWDYDVFGVTAGMSVNMPDATDDHMREIDQRIDDGDLSTGVFRKRSNGYIYIMQF